ncbi:MAG: 6-bladed beta-propeller [Zavarzinella sp.]
MYQLGNVTNEDAASQKFDFTNPTDVAVAPNGDIYVVDGYGSQKVHRFDKNFKLLKTIGKRGNKQGEFNVCHGIWINTIKKEPEVYIADRANNRIEVYSLELEYKRSIPGVRLPCCFYQHDGQIIIPELGARVSILDENDKLVTNMGDGAEAKTKFKTPDKTPQEFFVAPHALCTDSQGSIYVLEWVPFGRVRKFVRTPA